MSYLFSTSSPTAYAVGSNMLVLVGEQRIPNAIPVRQFPNSIKKVEMVYSKFTEPAATHLKAWLNVQGVEHQQDADSPELFIFPSPGKKQKLIMHPLLIERAKAAKKITTLSLRLPPAEVPEEVEAASK